MNLTSPTEVVLNLGNFDGKFCHERLKTLVCERISSPNSHPPPSDPAGEDRLILLGGLGEEDRRFRDAWQSMDFGQTWQELPCPKWSGRRNRLGFPPKGSDFLEGKWEIPCVRETHKFQGKSCLVKYYTLI